MSACQKSGAGVSPAPDVSGGGLYESLALARSPGRRDPSSVAALRRVDARPTLRSSSGRLISTARDEDPESIQTSRVSVALEVGSTPFQSFGRSKAQSSAHDFSNQTFEPFFSIRSAALRTICGSRIGW